MFLQSVLKATVGVGWFKNCEIVVNDGVQSHFGILASNTREESFGDKISQFLLGARIFCTESYNKDIGRENRHTWQKTSKFQVPGTQHSEYSQNHKQSETIILANGINRTKQTFCSVQLTL